MMNEPTTMQNEDKVQYVLTYMLQVLTEIVGEA